MSKALKNIVGCRHCVDYALMGINPCLQYMSPWGKKKKLIRTNPGNKFL